MLEDFFSSRSGLPGAVLLAGFALLATGATCTKGTQSSAHAATPTPKGFVIAVNREARTHVYAGASPMSQLAAAELCELLGRMTGAPFKPEPLPTSVPAAGIVVASADKDAIPASVPLSNGSEPSYDEGFTVHPEGSRLWLVGKTELGVHHAVFRLLREFGYRYFFQGRAWQIVPSTPTLSFAGSTISDHPALALRSMSGDVFAAHLNDRDHNQQRDQNDWRRQNGLKYAFTPKGQPRRTATTALTLTFTQGAFGTRESGKDSVYNFIAQVNAGKVAGYPPGWFEQDPARYGAPDDMRAKTVNVADLKVRDCFWTWLASGKQGQAEGVVNFSIEPSDGTSVVSRSPAALALGGDTDQLVFLANDLLSRMAKVPHAPQKYVTMLAGYFHALPPVKQVPSPNLFVGVMPVRQRSVGGYATTASLMKAWHERGVGVGLWENYSFGDRGLMGVGYTQEVSGSSDYVNDSRALPREYAEQAAAGSTAAVIETEDNFGRYGLGYYLATQLMWNPRADAAALREDFFQKAFPSDTAAMRSYYELFDPKGKSLLVSQDTLARAVRFLQRAGRAAAAAKNAGEVARIDDLKAFMHHNALWWKIYRAPHCGVSRCAAAVPTCAPRPECTISARQPSLTRELAEWDYRIRHSYMTSYRHDRVIATYDAAMQFDLPEFKAPASWERGGPPTHAEIEAAFAGDLALFTPEPVEQRQWSGDPISVPFEGLAAMDSELSSGGKLMSVALQASQGRVSIELSSGRSADRSLSPELPAEMFAPLRVWLTDSNGQPLMDTSGSALEQTLKPCLLPEQPRQVVTFERISPPNGTDPSKPFGVLLHVDAGGYKVLVRAPQAAPIALVADKQSRPLGVSVGSSGMYFYVPKRTTHIKYFWNRGRSTQGNDMVASPLQPHELVDSAGKVHRVTTGPQQLVSVAVPPGEDGKIWRIRKIFASQLWFYNVPPFLSASPKSVMLPRELAEADGWIEPQTGATR